MRVERYFLGWDTPVTVKLREFLLPVQFSGPIDLKRNLIVVPTRQAGRRLREALAMHCAKQGTALLSPRVVIPSFFFSYDSEPVNVTNQTLEDAVWATVLMNADLDDYSGLFPAIIPKQDFMWAMHTGEVIQHLRDAIVDGGYLIADVCRDFDAVLQELERWRDLAELETVYMRKLEELNQQDLCSFKINQSETPVLPEGVERIIVAVVPDPTPLMIRAIRHLSEQVSVSILIHAPTSFADHFDEWGRPLAERWHGSRIDIPDAEENVILAGSPASQSRKVVEIITAEIDRFGPADVAIGVPDGEVTPFLAADLLNNDLNTFDPAGKALSEHHVYSLLEAFRSLVTEGTYSAFGAFLRQADVLDCLGEKYGVSRSRMLEELDEFQNCHLPLGFEEIAGFFIQKKEGQRFPNLEKAVAFVQEQIQVFGREDIAIAVRLLLQTIYEIRLVNPADPDDEEFISVAELIDSALHEFDSECLNVLGIEKRHGLELLLRRLGGQRYYSERGGAVIDLEGWLELPWDDAPLLIVTGMNEGLVPDSQLGDVFLPDSLRRQLNLRQDADRLAVDAYLMKALIESRKEGGRVCFISGKANTAGDPLKPSRLLFRCSDEELPDRAQQLLGDPYEKRESYPPTVSFLLEAGPPPRFPMTRLELKELTVTLFKDYLTCPFRYYLKHVLGMEALDYEKTEMDALDFGSMIHYALQRMAVDDRMRECGNYEELRDFLCAEAESWVTKRFGFSRLLPIEIQLDAARQRLDAAARIQAELNRKGWEILESESRVEAEIDGIIIRGRIDRIDRHRQNGHLRVLDYKTSDKVVNPERDHLSFPSVEAQDYARMCISGRERRWLNLQLPLYQSLLYARKEFTGPIELGYFNLPKAVKDTGVAVWDDFSAELLESARSCAEGVLADIRDRRFWPPAKRVPYDDFSSLFPTDIADCIDIETFQDFLRGGQK